MHISRSCRLAFLLSSTQHILPSSASAFSTTRSTATTAASTAFLLHRTSNGSIVAAAAASSIGNPSSPFSSPPTTPPITTYQRQRQQQLRPSFTRMSSTTTNNNDNNNKRAKTTTTTTTPKTEGRVALLQFKVTPSKTTNYQTASTFLKQAAEAGASLAVLPEIWNGPYATAAFPEYAEVIPDVGYQLTDGGDGGCSSPSVELLLTEAKRYGMFIVGGSISERVSSSSTISTKEDTDKIYNTCICIDPTGTIVAKHRKVHLFDVDVPGGITFKESDTLSPGDSVTWFDAGEYLGKIGVGICYDIRFPEYALLLTQEQKCNVLIYPGAFNLTTGPAHWELLQKGRAVDNQCFVLTASPARTEAPTTTPPTGGDDDVEGGGKTYPHYTAWGHSTAIGPWGDVVATCDEGEHLVVCDLDVGKVREMRQGIPVALQKRGDLYRLTGTGGGGE